MQLTKYAHADLAIIVTIAHLQILYIAKMFIQIYSIVPQIGIMVVHNLNQNLTIFLIDKVDANDVEYTSMRS